MPLWLTAQQPPASLCPLSGKKLCLLASQGGVDNRLGSNSTHTLRLLEEQGKCRQGAGMPGWGGSAGGTRPQQGEAPGQASARLCAGMHSDAFSANENGGAVLVQGAARAGQTGASGKLRGKRWELADNRHGRAGGGPAVGRALQGSTRCRHPLERAPP